MKFAEGRDFSSHQLCYWGVKVRRAEGVRQGDAVPGPGRRTDIRLSRVLRVATAGISSAPVVVEVHGVRVVVACCCHLRLAAPAPFSDHLVLSFESPAVNVRENVLRTKWS